MKILHIIPSMDPKTGGPVEGLKNLAINIFRLDSCIDILCLDNPNEKWLIDSKIKIYTIKGFKFLTYKYCIGLISYIRANHYKYDAIVVNGLWQYHSFATWFALLGSNKPYYIFTHGMLDPWFKKAYPLKHIKKLIYWFFIEYRVIRDAKRIFFTCDEERLLARGSFSLYKANEYVLGYGINPPSDNIEKFLPIFYAQYPQLKGKRVVLFLSRIDPKKGCDLLINAFAHISECDDNLRLVIAGPDDNGWSKKLKLKAISLGIADKVVWTGMLTGGLKWGAFSAAEVFCLPSHQENFGIVVAEALACGKPVLITDKVNIWREIQAADAGFISKDTLNGTISNLEQWLLMSDQDYLIKKNNAIKCFHQNFIMEKVASNFINVLSSDISSTHSP